MTQDQYQQADYVIHDIRNVKSRLEWLESNQVDLDVKMTFLDADSRKDSEKFITDWKAEVTESFKRYLGKKLLELENKLAKI